MGSSAPVWLLKPPVVLVALVAAAIAHLYLLVPALIGGFWWLRRPGRPVRLKDGTWVLPRPFLWGVLGHPGVFFNYNTVGPGGIRTGSRFGPFGSPQIKQPDQIAEVTSDVGLGWLFGAGQIVVSDTGRDKNTIWVATWTSADEMVVFVLDAVTR